jgi:hypothetical protein
MRQAVKIDLRAAAITVSKGDGGKSSEGNSNDDCFHCVVCIQKQKHIYCDFSEVFLEERTT